MNSSNISLTTPGPDDDFQTVIEATEFRCVMENIFVNRIPDKRRTKDLAKDKTERAEASDLDEPLLEFVKEHERRKYKSI